MSGRGYKRELTDDEWRFVIEMIRKNQSKTTIARGLSMNRATFNRIINENEQLAEEMQKAKEDRMAIVKSKAQDAIEMLLTKHEYYETKVKSEPRPKVTLEPVLGDDGQHLRDKKGALRFAEIPVLDVYGQQVMEMVVTEKIRTKKVIMPNASVTMWAAMNTMPDKYKPANKTEVSVENRPNHNFEIVWRETPGSKEVGK